MGSEIWRTTFARGHGTLRPKYEVSSGKTAKHFQLEFDLHGYGRRERETGTRWRPEDDWCSPVDDLENQDWKDIEVYAMRKGPIPEGHAVLDTGCLRGCGGSISLDGYTDDCRVTTRMKGSAMRFRGVNDSAPVTAEGEQEVSAGLAGADVNLRFQRLPKSKTPILMSVHQLEELDTILYIKECKADFKAIQKYGFTSTRQRRGT